MTSAVLLPLFGLAVGILVGAYAPVSIPLSMAKYTAVAILAALDTSLGGVRAGLENRFDLFSFISLLAAALTYLGDRLGIDLYMAAVVVFGVRLFDNLAIVRRLVMNRFWSH
jgi:small basic protein